MKKVLCLLCFLSLNLVCYADWNTYETRQEAYNRRSNENYNTYHNNNHQMPLGGYNRSINDNGGREYGSNYSSSGMSSLNNNHNNNYSRGGNSWNSF